MASDDFEESGNFLYTVGESSYVFEEKDDEEFIKAAGTAIMDGADSIGRAIGVVPGSSVVIGFVEGFAELTYVIVLEPVGEAFAEGFTLAFEYIVIGLRHIGQAVLDAGEAIVDGVGLIIFETGELFGGLF